MQSQSASQVPGIELQKSKQFPLPFVNELLVADAKHGVQILRDTRAHKLTGMELEARLLMAGLEKKSHRDGAARDQFFSMKKTVRAKGYGLMSGKAAAFAADL